jgi:hypothetical protein
MGILGIVFYLGLLFYLCIVDCRRNAMEPILVFMVSSATLSGDVGKSQSRPSRLEA